MNKEQIIKAYQDWEDFVNSLNDQEKSELVNYNEYIDNNCLHYYISINDNIRFDQSVNRLSKKHLYDEEIIPVIYNYYIERNLDELAYDYICKSEVYLKDSKTIISPNIQAIIDNSESKNLLSKYRISFDRIRGLSPSSLPHITPDCINNKRQLNKFILNELIQSLKIINEKKEALRQVTHENRYNDFLQAILRFRFPIWGWSIQDQPRLGTSTGGADAGNADLVIQSGGGVNIALIEAFILRDKDYTETHILKCPKYVGTINKYYVVVYYLENTNNFDSKWSTYKNDVLNLNYPSNFMIDKSIGFTDLETEFEDVNNLKISKTSHSSNVEMFHIMINLSL